jgi:hypothetical protein
VDGPTHSICVDSPTHLAHRSPVALQPAQIHLLPTLSRSRRRLSGPCSLPRSRRRRRHRRRLAVARRRRRRRFCDEPGPRLVATRLAYTRAGLTCARAGPVPRGVPRAAPLSVASLPASVVAALARRLVRRSVHAGRRRRRGLGEREVGRGGGARGGDGSGEGAEGRDEVGRVEGGEVRERLEGLRGRVRDEDTLELYGQAGYGTRIRLRRLPGAKV